MSALARVFLILHVVMAVVMVGAGYAQPIVMAGLKQGGANRVPLMRVSKGIAKASRCRSSSSSRSPASVSS